MLVPNWTLLDCEIVSGAAQIGHEWRALTSRSLVPSGHNAPELQAAAMRQWPEGRIATVRDSGGLRLALPVTRRNLPVPIFENWSSPVNFYGMPHVDRDAAGPALTCLLRKIARPLLLHSVPTSGFLNEALMTASGRFAVLDRWERAVLRPQGTYQDWFEASFERKRRKEYRRLQARLSEQGKLEALSFQTSDDPATWASEFLALEAAGWKGARGTAMRTSERTVAAFQDASASLARAGRLRFWKLALDGKPVAMMFAVVDGTEAWLGKIAHDEALGRFSPGVLLILHATQQIFAEGLSQVDSCAIPNHPMINQLWRDRLQVADVMVAGTTVRPLAFSLAVSFEQLRRKLRRAAKAVYLKLSGRRAS